VFEPSRLYASCARCSPLNAGLAADFGGARVGAQWCVLSETHHGLEQTMHTRVAPDLLVGSAIVEACRVRLCMTWAPTAGQSLYSPPDAGTAATFTSCTPRAGRKLSLHPCEGDPMRLPIASMLLCLLVTSPARAALPNGAQAPDFQAEASLGGKTFKFSLAEALRKGPIVLYFYPAAFTPGCTAEAHDFAQATDEYKALGAAVIGVSHDTIDTLNRFSVSECRSKFAVAADTDQAIMKSYDAVLARNPEYADRTSYVIAPDRRIVYSYTNLDPGKHVENTMAALREWLASQKKP